MTDQNDNPAEDEDKVFDVSKPGESTAEPTSKPVIVHRKRIKNDPMVVDSSDGEANQDEKPIEDKPEEVKITPAASSKPEEEEPSPPPEPEPAKTQDSISDGASETAQPKQDSAPTDTNQSPEATAGTDENQPPENKFDSAEVEALAEEANTGKQSKKQAELDNKKTQDLQQLVDSRKYFLNIGEIKRRRTTAKLFIALIIIVILAAVTYNLALDADIINSQFQPVTDILYAAFC